MGKAASKLSAEEIEELTIVCNFTEPELQRLAALFQKLDKDMDSRISLAEFMEIPQLQFNPFLPRIIEVLGLNQTTSMRFQQFVQYLSVFSENAPKDAKLRFAFRLYDLDNDQMLCVADLEGTLSTIIGEQLGEKKVQEIVQRTMDELDVDGDKLLSFAEFSKGAVAGELFRKLTILF